MSASITRKVGIAALIMMASVFLSRVIGLLREMAIAYVGGAGSDVDAYQIAFVIPEILNHIVASGFLSVTFIPIFTRYLVKNREADGWAIFSIVFTGFGGLLMILVLITIAAAPKLVSLLAPGLEDPTAAAAAVRMTRIIIPAQLFFFWGGLFMAVQFAKEKFFLPALAPLLYNLGIIAGGLLFGASLGMEGFAWGVLIGAFIGNFVVQYIGARRVGLKLQLKLDLFHPDLVTYVKVTLPLMVGLTMMFSTEIFLKFFGSYLPPGSIAGLNYGFRVMLMVVGLFGQAVGMAATPYLSRLVAENRFDEMNRLLNTTLRFIALVILVSVTMMVLRTEIVQILFQRGRFDNAATAVTSKALLVLMIGTVAFAAQTVVVRGYYAMQNTMLPAVLGTIAVCLSLPLYLIGTMAFGVTGLGAAISLSAVIQVSVLYMIWNRKTRNTGSRTVTIHYLKIAILGVLFFPVLVGVKNTAGLWFKAGRFVDAVAVCLITGSAFLLLLPLAGRLFNIPEIREVWQRINEKLGLRRSV